MTPPPPPPPPPSQTTPAPANRLADSNSPYLLQHAHNPVDWYPWGEEAFAEARRRDVPIFVSVGYSTCYWCHVMERESFEDEATAAVMNERFVCVKVDREERPDVDELTMSATVIFTGRGGWPTSVFLEPESLRPFFAGTYFPNEPRHGMPSFTHVLESLSNAWTGQRAEVIAQAEAISEAVREQVAASHEPVPVGQADIERAVSTLLQMFDRANGGFGGAPKFPQPSFIEFLLDARATADEATRAAIDTAIRTTLDAMMIGGIHDHLAGGFHRYAVDEFWTVPHFEKMLYDNAQLASLYARAASVYEDDQYARTARTTADFVLTVMSPVSGSGKSGFFSAKDAEVDHREGLDYLWTAEEFAEALGEDDAALASRVFGLDQGPNFQDPHHPEEPRRSVLRLETRRDQLAGSLGKDADQLNADLARITAALLAHRDTRKQSAIDDKVIAGWNGLMISGLARTASVSGQDAQRYLDAGFDAARFVLGSMRNADSGLLRASRNGSAAIDAPLEDHAFMIQGLLTLAEASPASAKELIESATKLTEHAMSEFADESGRFYDTRADRPDLFARTRSTHDGATPSAIGVMLQNFIALHRLTGDDAWLGHAGRVLESMSHTIHENPVSCVNATRQLLAMLRLGDSAAAHYTFAVPSEREPVAPAQTRQPVRVMANADQLVVTPDTPAVFSIALEMDPGWHIVAAQPVAEGQTAVPVTPLRVGLTSGMGVAVYAEYPEGTSFGVPGIGEIFVHEDRVEFRVMLEHKPGVGASPGTPVLGVSFQACNDRECAPPRTVELEIAVEIKPE